MTFDIKNLKVLLLLAACLFIFMGVSCDVACDEIPCNETDCSSDCIDDVCNQSDSVDDVLSETQCDDGSVFNTFSDKALDTACFFTYFDVCSSYGVDIENDTFDVGFLKDVFEDNVKIYNVSLVNSMPEGIPVSIDSFDYLAVSPVCFADSEVILNSHFPKDTPADKTECAWSKDISPHNNLFINESPKVLASFDYIADLNSSISNFIFTDYASQFSCEMTSPNRNHKYNDSDAGFYDYSILTDDFNADAGYSRISDETDLVIYSNADNSMDYIGDDLYCLNDSCDLKEYSVAYSDSVFNDLYPGKVESGENNYALTFTSYLGYISSPVAGIKNRQYNTITAYSAPSDELYASLNIEGAYTLCCCSVFEFDYLVFDESQTSSLFANVLKHSSDDALKETVFNDSTLSSYLLENPVLVKNLTYYGDNGFSVFKNDFFGGVLINV